MRPGSYQANCNAGEISPEARGNTGLKQYYSGLSRAENIAPVPQGGFDLLPRTRFLADLGPATGEVALHRFTVDRDNAYVAVLTAGSGRLFELGAPVGTIALPFADAEIPFVRSVQRRETMFLFHQAHPPRRVMRHGADTAWTTDDVVWTEIPRVDYGGTYVDTAEVWVLRLTWTGDTVVVGLGFQISVDGEQSTMITVPSASGSPDWAATATAIRAAIEALAGVDAGIAVTLGAAGGRYQEFQVTFTGGRNAGQNFTVTGAVALDTTASLNTSRTTKGKPGGEEMMSVSRGWLRCGAWFQDRLLLGSLAAKPSAFAASRTGEYFDLNVELQSESGAMLVNLDADGGEEILHLIQGQYLGILTNCAEYHLADRALKRGTPPNIVRSSTNGSSARVPPVEQENSILYVSREETVVYAATYDAVSTSFQSVPLSILSSHLITGIRGADLQVSHQATDAQRYFLPRDDGLLVIACLIRNQDVSPFVRWTTDGRVRAVCVDGANRPHLVVDRLVGGEWRRFLEVMDDDTLFDAAVTRTFSTPTVVVDGLGAHEGATVWADADGWIEGPFTVSAGRITLAHPASVVTVGRWSPPVATTLPLVRDLGGRQVLKRPARVHTVQLDVIDTTSIAIGANGGTPKDVALGRFGDPVDAPPPPRTGDVIRTGLTGFSLEGLVTITQVRPGRLQVRGLTIQARV